MFIQKAVIEGRLFSIPWQEDRSSSGASDMKDYLQLQGIKKGFREEVTLELSTGHQQHFDIGRRKEEHPGEEEPCS